MEIVSMVLSLLSMSIHIDLFTVVDHLLSLWNRFQDSCMVRSVMLSMESALSTRKRNQWWFEPELKRKTCSMLFSFLFLRLRLRHSANVTFRRQIVWNFLFIVLVDLDWEKDVVVSFSSRQLISNQSVILASSDNTLRMKTTSFVVDENIAWNPSSLIIRINCRNSRLLHLRKKEQREKLGKKERERHWIPHVAMFVSKELRRT